MTSQQIQALRAIAKAILATITECKEAPAGVLYAGLMAQGCSLDQFQSIMGTLERNGFVSLECDVYRATGKQL